MKPELLQKELQARGFIISHVIGRGKYKIHSLYIDETNRKWCYNNIKDKRITIQSFDDLLDVRLEDKFEQRTRGGGTGALVGGALFGGTGAVVGNALSTKKTKQVLSSRTIVVTTNSFTDNIIKINAGVDNEALYTAFQVIKAKK